MVYHMRKMPITQEFINGILERRDDPNYNAMMRINDISRLHRDHVRREGDEDGMPNSYRLILFHLAHLDPGVTQLTLVKAANLKPPTVSVTLQKMESEGLVIRKSNEHDLRQTLVYLSDKGRAINERIHNSFASGDSIAMEGLSEEERATLCKLLDKVADNLMNARENV